MKQLQAIVKDTDFAHLTSPVTLTIHGHEQLVDWRLDMGGECICAGQQCPPPANNAPTETEPGSIGFDRALIICMLLGAEYFAYADAEELVLYQRRSDGLHAGGGLEDLREVLTQRADSWRDLLFDLEEELHSVQRPTSESLDALHRMAAASQALFPEESEAGWRKVLDESQRFSAWRDEIALVKKVLDAQQALHSVLLRSGETSESDAVMAAAVELAEAAGLPDPSIPF